MGRQQGHAFVQIPIMITPGWRGWIALPHPPAAGTASIKVAGGVLVAHPAGVCAIP